MYLTIFDRIEQVNQDVLTVDVASLYRAFEQVKDGQRKKGTCYPFDFFGVKKRCFTNATFLCTATRSPTIVAWQALKGKRVHLRALRSS